VGAELVSVSSDEAVVLRDGAMVAYRDLPPAATLLLDGVEVTTLPRPGQRLGTVATTNDVHFGERECGRLGDADIGPVFSTPEGQEPYAAMMNRLAVADIALIEPDAVVVKGDLTDAGRPGEYADFLACYGAAFGDRLTHVRGNHDCGQGQSFADRPFQEIRLEGAAVALLDTCRPGHVNGTLGADQLDQLDELGARSEVPVLVMGHHPVWDGRVEKRTDQVFGLLPEPSEALIEVFARRPRLVVYAAGHTHRTHVAEIGGVPFVEVAALKDFPGAWCEYQVFEGGILQVVRRAGRPEALAWSEKTRGMFGGFYGAYAYGSVAERCRLIRTDRRS
jgi:3',5'-cyclic-AMP phosphodiesterase